MFISDQALKFLWTKIAARAVYSHTVIQRETVFLPEIKNKTKKPRIIG